jgi:hypothetical protein
MRAMLLSLGCESEAVAPAEVLPFTESATYPVAGYASQNRSDSQTRRSSPSAFKIRFVLGVEGVRNRADPRCANGFSRLIWEVVLIGAQRKAVHLTPLMLKGERPGHPGRGGRTASARAV